MDEASFTKCKWSYIDSPDREELRAAEDKSLNRLMGGLKCDSKKLSGCRTVFYCDVTCQRADWGAHKNDCKMEKVVLRPNPRSPLSAQLAAAQAEAQEEHSRLLQAVLAGNFTGSMFFLPEQSGGTTVENAKAGVDLNWRKIMHPRYFQKDFPFF